MRPRATMAGLFLLLALSGAALAAEKTAGHYVPADAWVVVWYDGSHAGLGDTPLARFLQEPEVRDTLKQLRPVLEKVLEDGNEDLGLDLAPILGAALGCDIAIAALGPRPGADEPTGLIVAKVGAAGSPARDHAEALLKRLVADGRPETVRQVDIAGIKATTLVNGDGEPSAFGFDGPFLILAGGEELLRRVLDPATPKLADKVGGERAVLRVRYDHLAMLKAFGNRIEPEARRVLEAAGVNALAAAELALVPRAKRLATTLAIDLPAGAGRQGLLRGLGEAPPYDPEMLKYVPRDALLFWLGNIDFAWGWDEAWAMLGRVNAAAAKQAQEALAVIEQKGGFKVRDGLLAPMGRGTLLVARPDGLLGGWAAIVQRMRDPDAFEKGVAQLVARLDLVLMELPDVGFVRTDLKAFQYRGHTCRYLWVMGRPAVILSTWIPCYARLGNDFVFATNPLQLKGFLDSVEDKGPTIRENEEFQSLLALVPKGATSVGYTSWANGIEAAYNTFAPLLALLQGVPELEGKVDLANLPSSRLVRRYMRGTIGYTAFEAGRFRAETHTEGFDVLGPHLLTVAGIIIPAAILLAGGGPALDLPPEPIEAPMPPPKKAVPKDGPQKGEF